MNNWQSKMHSTYGRWAMDFIEAAADGFQLWLGDHDHTIDAELETIPLARCLQEWVEEGDGIESCAGDYILFLRTALVLADMYQRGQGARTRGPDRVRGLLGDNGSICLDPDWWNWHVFYHTTHHSGR